MKDKEKILCDDCAHNMIRNLACGLNSYVCKSCEKKWKISGAIPITHGQYAQRDLTDRLLELLRAAEGSSAPRQAPNSVSDRTARPITETVCDRPQS